MSRKFGVAFDNSDLSHKAVQLCLSLMKEGDEIHILTVVEPVRTDPPFGYSVEVAEGMINERKAECKKNLMSIEDACEQSPIPISWRVYVEVGDPRTTVVEFVERLNLDMLFMGCRGLSGLAGFFMGSSSQYALHNCPCPVTIVK